MVRFLFNKKLKKVQQQKNKANEICVVREGNLNFVGSSKSSLEISHYFLSEDAESLKYKVY